MSTKLAATVTMQMEMDVTLTMKQAASQARAVAGAPALGKKAEAELVRQSLEALAAQARKAGDELRRRTREALPEGVTLVEMTQRQEGARVRSTVRFELVDLRLLPKIAVATDGGGTAQPFAGFKVTRHGETLVLEGATPSIPAPPKADGAVRLEVATEAAAQRHSATRTRGASLIWERALGAKPLAVSATWAVAR